MQDYGKLKYAELRKLAKKAGIKANLKQEKLVAELTKYFEKNVNQRADQVKSETTGSVKERKSTSLEKSRTPVLAVKTHTASKPQTPTRVNMPSSTLKNQDQSETPGSAKPKSRWEKKVFSPAVAARSASPSVKPNISTVKVATPTIKSSTKSATPSTKPTAVDGKTPTSNKVSLKRKPSDTPEVSQPAKKRRSTFEKAPVPTVESPSVDENNTKKRRSTFEKAPTPNLKTPEVASPRRRRSGRQSNGSPVTEMLGAMKDGMNNEEMKQSLMAVLDKRVQEKVKTEPALGSTSTSIPRFVAFVKKRQEAKPITPVDMKNESANLLETGNKDWDKIHKKNFEKFDPIDVYLEKKRKRAEEISASVKKAKKLLGEVHSAADKLKSHKTPDTNENKFIKPRTSNANKTTPFKPTVLNTTKLNLNFGAKKSPKTLPRKSPKSVISSTVKINQPPVRKSTGSTALTKPTTTPFKFTATSTLNNTIASSKKQAFDLKASLAKPITWKTHKGKLKPIQDSTKSPVYIKPISAAKIKKGREVTRTNVAKRRADKKHDARMARRGIKV